MPKGEHLGEFEQLVILSLLRCEADGRPAYGMEVVREIEDVAERSATIGSVYGTLERLEEKGLLSSWHGEPDPERGGRPPRYFRVEPEGRRALAETRAMTERMWDGVRLDPEILG